MNREYKRRCKKILKNYQLTKEQKDRLHGQIDEILNNFEGDAYLSLGDPNNFINELFDINDITPILKSNSIYYSKGIFSKLAGITLIIGGLIYLFTDYDVYDIAVYSTFILLIVWIITTIILRTFNFFYLVFLIPFIWILDIPQIEIFNDVDITSIMIALLIILVGLSLIFKRHTIYKPTQSDFTFYDSKDYQSSYTGPRDKAIFLQNKAGELNKNFTSENVNYIQVENKMGSTNIDLRNFTFNEGDITLDIYCKMGDTKIFINDNVNVIETISNKYGEVSSRNYNPQNFTHTVYISGEVFMGNIDIK